MVAECLIFLFKFRKLFLLHLLACFRDFPLEIPLAHCVRGGMVRTGKGKSYYGQYGCSDDLTSADTAEINHHRADIGLEPLEAKRRDKNVIYITY